MKGVDLSLVNALRRIILSEIPCVAFDESSFKIITNDGPLHNEIMSHRFSLIPIHFNDSENENMKPEDYEFELHVSNTDNKDKIMPVTTRDFKVKYQGNPAKDLARLFPPNPVTGDFILITKLRPGETIHAKGTVTQNIAKNNATYCPVSLCNFKYVLEPSPETDSVLDKERKYAQNEYGDPLEFIFEIEAENGMSVKYLFSKAIDILMKKLESSPQLAINEDSTQCIFTFEGEDDTLGNLLQSYLHTFHIRSGNAQNVTYVGYYCPHPLESVMKLKVCTQTSCTNVEFKNILEDQYHRCLVELDNMKQEWNQLQI